MARVQRAFPQREVLEDHRAAREVRSDLIRQSEGRIRQFRDEIGRTGDQGDVAIVDRAGVVHSDALAQRTAWLETVKTGGDVAAATAAATAVEADAHHRVMELADGTSPETAVALAAEDTACQAVAAEIVVEGAEIMTERLVDERMAATEAEAMGDVDAARLHLAQADALASHADRIARSTGRIASWSVESSGLLADKVAAVERSGVGAVDRDLLHRIVRDASELAHVTAVAKDATDEVMGRVTMPDDVDPSGPDRSSGTDPYDTDPYDTDPYDMDAGDVVNGTDHAVDGDEDETAANPTAGPDVENTTNTDQEPGTADPSPGLIPVTPALLEQGVVVGFGGEVASPEAPVSGAVLFDVETGSFLDGDGRVVGFHQSVVSEVSGYVPGFGTYDGANDRWLDDHGVPVPTDVPGLPVDGAISLDGIDSQDILAVLGGGGVDGIATYTTSGGETGPRVVYQVGDDPTLAALVQDPYSYERLSLDVTTGQLFWTDIEAGTRVDFDTGNWVPTDDGWLDVTTGTAYADLGQPGTTLLDDPKAPPSATDLEDQPTVPDDPTAMDMESDEEMDGFGSGAEDEAPSDPSGPALTDEEPAPVETDEHDRSDPADEPLIDTSEPDPEPDPLPEPEPDPEPELMELDEPAVPLETFEADPA